MTSNLPEIKDHILVAIRNTAKNGGTFAIAYAKKIDDQDYCIYRETPESTNTVSAVFKGNKNPLKLQTQEALLGAIIADWQLRSSWAHANSQLKRPSNADRFFFEGRDLTNYLKGITKKPVATDIESLTAIGQEYMAEVKALPVYSIQ